LLAAFKFWQKNLITRIISNAFSQLAAILIPKYVAD
jgi:hypothetical protein